ncbi:MULTISPECIES: HAMP domain-containing sensor histidine kinase [unclassified Novosphingobium]|uniref:sensor histidine kinase n=1 Tax=unclassified Novosphingobium TaxID=2644732 RepID=UPI001356E111|nr:MULTISPECIES: HAMP domain-containing sensor histidine kinase [unclassified Novosphingobium]
MKRLLRSFSFRLALTYAGLFCLSVALLMSAGYWLRVTLPMDRTRKLVNTEYHEFRAAYLAHGFAATRLALDRRASHAGDRKAFHALLAPDGHVATANLPSWPAKPLGRLTIIEADTFVDGTEIDHNALVSDHLLPGGARLMIGRDVGDITDDADSLRTAAIWIFGVTVMLGLSGGWLMSRAIGRRIEAVTLAARQVMDGDLAGRVQVRGTNDDFDRLGETLNLMLSRIQSLFSAVQSVSDNAAHELRTPLARLIGRLESLEQIAGDDPAMRMAASGAIVEANRLQQILSALMRISRLENGRHPLELQRTDVIQLLEDIVEFYQPEAERLGMELTVSARRPLVADLDLDLVFQALSNLLDNALKHGAGLGRRIELAAAKTRDGLHLSVLDDGPGLDAGDAERVTQQFYRGRSSARLPGDGLGLSMVAAIAHAHGATLEFEAAKPGLRVSLVFP